MEGADIGEGAESTTSVFTVQRVQRSALLHRATRISVSRQQQQLVGGVDSECTPSLSIAELSVSAAARNLITAIA
jgi:hypothetical protein